MGKYVYVRDKKTKANEPGWWSEKKKHEAVCLYAAGLGIKQISMETAVPYHTVKDWQKQQWWRDALAELRSDDKQKLDAKLTKILDKTLESIMDRLENGEYIYDQKTGKLKQTPVKMRDATVAFNTIMDKRQLIRKEPTKIVEQSSTADQLKSLADQFAAFVTGIKKTEPMEKLVTEFIDGDNVEQQPDGGYELKE